MSLVSRRSLITQSLPGAAGLAGAAAVLRGAQVKLPPGGGVSGAPPVHLPRSWGAQSALHSRIVNEFVVEAAAGRLTPATRGKLSASTSMLFASLDSAGFYDRAAPLLRTASRDSLLVTPEKIARYRSASLARRLPLSPQFWERASDPNLLQAVNGALPDLSKATPDYLRGVVAQAVAALDDDARWTSVSPVSYRGGVRLELAAVPSEERHSCEGGYAIGGALIGFGGVIAIGFFPVGAAIAAFGLGFVVGVGWACY